MNDDYITISPHFNPDPYRFRTYTVTFFSTPIITTVTTTPSVVRNWLFRVLPTLQLCIGHQCLIFQLLHADTVPLSLRRFLNDPRNTFVGVWNHSDIAMLLRSEHRLSVSRVVDARHVAAERNGLSPQLSMEKLAEILLGAPDVRKPQSIGVSNWNDYRLSLEQIQYACVDAYVSFELGR
ncbi:hypothetical protein Golax_009945, partial [Gossypium laxum]|nr:hypothetical protein [Gossypium laxum]